MNAYNNYPVANMSYKVKTCVDVTPSQPKSEEVTIYKWRQSRSFPEPVTLMPLRWLRSAVEEWKMQVGGCSR